jgi:preprotein translocase subunit SecD
VPFGSEKYLDRNGQAVIVQKQVILTGENLTDAQPGFDSQTQEPTVNLTLDAKGARIFKDVTRENVGKRMAIILFEKGKGEVVTARDPWRNRRRPRADLGPHDHGGSQRHLAAAARRLAGRAHGDHRGIHHRPEPGRRQHRPRHPLRGLGHGGHRGLHVRVLHAVRRVLHDRAGVNVLLLVAMLSMLQATLTLPGIAAMALALGVAIDSNVLINERIREELRAGASPQAAIHAGYERAWHTILDSNVTTLIAGLALLAFGSARCAALPWCTASAS